MRNIVQVTHVDSIKDKTKDGFEYIYGDAKVYPRGESGDVRIARNKNQTLAVWLQTYVHEMIHIASDLFIPLMFRVRVDGHSEHKFIEKIEEAILKHSPMLKEMHRGKKKGKKAKRGNVRLNTKRLLLCRDRRR